MNEVKQNTFLKVMAIIMLIGGILGAIVSLIGIAGVAVLALAGANSTLLYLSVAIAVLGAVLQIIAGGKGLGAAKNPAKIPGCIKIGVVVIVVSILSTVVSLIGGGEFKITNLITSLIVPVLYTVAAAKK
ncbi:MAG: hypothetical protein IKM59_04280 [Oscillospiraceae bacterium]|nr:hypothetical protein [Oscillospiraceae bacterium]